MKTPRSVLPNSITLALKDKVEGGEVIFTPYDPANNSITKAGILTLPFQYLDSQKTKAVRDSGDSLAWVIDGQHRLEALDRMKYTTGTFPVFFTAIVTEDIRWQTELFARINLTLPPKKQDIERILAIVEGELKGDMARKQLASRIRERMLNEPSCPFNDLVKR